jgi:hypothetical protein
MTPERTLQVIDLHDPTNSGDDASLLRPPSVPHLIQPSGRTVPAVTLNPLSAGLRATFAPDVMRRFRAIGMQAGTSFHRMSPMPAGQWQRSDGQDLHGLRGLRQVLGTPVEVLVALMLMALLAIAPIFIYAAKSTASSGEHGKAELCDTENGTPRAAAFDTDRG